ncbi:hypothetical protein NUW54_g11416 [Trametes sanguinea]|uniref:Uncharacterized protein n=1 Tax=Trametes sanguinea TaxID=158606 RepID=A0ACC1NF91_9APHY|nr:hypothetical protein NUW54_g11416 [Trametes sanguinea]
MRRAAHGAAALAGRRGQGKQLLYGKLILGDYYKYYGKLGMSFESIEHHTSSVLCAVPKAGRVQPGVDTSGKVTGHAFQWPSLAPICSVSFITPISATPISATVRIVPTISATISATIPAAIPAAVPATIPTVPCASRKYNIHTSGTAMVMMVVVMMPPVPV